MCISRPGLHVQAAKLADGLRTAPSAVLAGLIAKAGALTVTNLHDYEEVRILLQVGLHLILWICPLESQRVHLRCDRCHDLY